MYSFCIPQHCLYSGGQLTFHLNYSLIQPLIFQGQALGTYTCHDPLKTTRTAWESANELQTDSVA